jgi:hypothetical protein
MELNWDEYKSLLMPTPFTAMKAEAQEVLFPFQKALELALARLAGALQGVPLEKRVDALEADMKARFADIESRIRHRAPPERFTLNPNPRLEWISKNRHNLIDKYPGEWIAVSRNGLLGHNLNLENLRNDMSLAGHSDATYIKVGRPLSQDSANESVL